MAWDRAAAVWLATVFAEPSNWDALPDDCRNLEWLEEIENRVRNNDIVLLVTAVDHEAAGLFWSAPWESGIWSCHQFVMPRFRGWRAFRMADVAARKLFEVVPTCTHLMGFTPVDNRAALVCASKAGFTDSGLMPRYYLHHGKLHDCRIMVRTRNNG